jgi:hypothetical protein
MVDSNDVALVAGELTVVFRRYLSVAFAAGLIGTFSLMQPAHVAELWRPSAAAAPIPDPPPLLPCNMQSWYNADRICLSWTAKVAVGWRCRFGSECRCDRENAMSRSADRS